MPVNIEFVSISPIVHKKILYFMMETECGDIFQMKQAGEHILEHCTQCCPYEQELCLCHSIILAFEIFLTM